MRVVAVNVGLPRQVFCRGEPVTTGIFKESVAGPVRIAGVNLDGDAQADVTVHGGRDKAVYAYPAEHYLWWQEELGRELPWGSFGENLTVEGMPLEDETAVGDCWRVGTAELVVTQPRLPCFKLGIRFGDPGMVKRFLASGRSGFYFRIAREGTTEAGDPIELLSHEEPNVPVSEITRLYLGGWDDIAGLRRAVTVASLPRAGARTSRSCSRTADDACRRPVRPLATSRRSSR
jgi:MOSC domain-containing protein YiiM